MLLCAPVATCPTCFDLLINLQFSVSSEWAQMILMITLVYLVKVKRGKRPHIFFSLYQINILASLSISHAHGSYEVRREGKKFVLKPGQYLIAWLKLDVLSEAYVYSNAQVSPGMYKRRMLFNSLKCTPTIACELPYWNLPSELPISPQHCWLSQLELRSRMHGSAVFENEQNNVCAVFQL